MRLLVIFSTVIFLVVACNNVEDEKVKLLKEFKKMQDQCVESKENKCDKEQK